MIIHPERRGTRLEYDLLAWASASEQTIAPEAKAIVTGARIDADEWEKTTVMLVDAKRKIIASSNDSHNLNDPISLETSGRNSGYYVASDKSIVAFHATPGYETYRGLGWYGVIKRKL